MKKIVDYAVITEYNEEDLMEEVGVFIKSGYQPYGDLKMFHAEDDDEYWIQYGQAMVRYEE